MNTEDPRAYLRFVIQTHRSIVWFLFQYYLVKPNVLVDNSLFRNLKLVKINSQISLASEKVPETVLHPWPRPQQQEKEKRRRPSKLNKPPSGTVIFQWATKIKLDHNCDWKTSETIHKDMIHNCTRLQWKQLSTTSNTRKRSNIN